MAKFRCPRCGAVVEGIHDRCPRCKVLFKYRKEDVEQLTVYQPQEVSVPERIPEPVPAPAPVVEEPAPEVKPEVAEEKMYPAVIEEPKPVKVGPSKEEIEKMKKKGTAALVFGIIGFLFSGVLTWIIGLIFSILAINNAKKSKPYGGGKATAGKGLGIAGLVFSIISIILAVLLAVALIIGLIALIAWAAQNPEAFQALLNGGQASMML